MIDPSELEKSSGIQSVERAVAVLDAVAAHADEGCRLADVVRATDLGRATAHRFMRALEQLGLIELEARSGRYFPGIRLAALGAAAGNRFGLAQRAQPSLKRLAARTSDTVYLSLRVGDEALCIAREEGAFPIKTLTVKAGDRRPLGVGAGPLAMLSFLSPEEIERQLEAAAATIITFGLDSATVHEMVEASRRCGYALNDGRVIPGMAAVGVPISTTDGYPIGAISVAAISTRLEPARRTNVVAWIREEVARIEADLAPLLGPMATASLAALLGSGSANA
jgi:DNA-binding IclR family transcriptional regulator